jgi:ClpP class serine protease
MKFAYLAQRLFNRPLAILPDKAEVVMAALSERLGVTHLFRDGDVTALRPAAFVDVYEDDDNVYLGDSGASDTGYDVVAGVAVIPIEGTLVQKSGQLRPFSGMTGYDGIRQAFITALGDADVRAIALQIDSPGGDVAGLLDLTDLIYQARDIKPIWSILDEGAYSAAYILGSAASYLTVPRTGGTGSIGVIALHVDFSRALTSAGLKVTLLTYGDHKADGHSEIPLSAEARERMEADIAATGALLDAAVARNRGMKAKQVHDLQAGTFLGQAGLEAGLVDAVMAPDAAFRALVQQLNA